MQFYAAWCGHCKAIAPHWARVAAAFAGDPRVTLAKVNGDNNQRLMRRYDVKGYPNMLLFSKSRPDGELYRGVRTFDALLAWLEARVGKPLELPRRAPLVCRRQQLRRLLRAQLRVAVVVVGGEHEAQRLVVIADAQRAQRAHKLAQPDEAVLAALTARHV